MVERSTGSAVPNLDTIRVGLVEPRALAGLPAAGRERS